MEDQFPSDLTEEGFGISFFAVSLRQRERQNQLRSRRTGRFLRISSDQGESSCQHSARWSVSERNLEGPRRAISLQEALPEQNRAQRPLWQVFLPSSSAHLLLRVVRSTVKKKRISKTRQKYKSVTHHKCDSLSITEGHCSKKRNVLMSQRLQNEFYIKGFLQCSPCCCHSMELNSQRQLR